MIGTPEALRFPSVFAGRCTSLHPEMFAQWYEDDGLIVIWRRDHPCLLKLERALRTKT